MRNFILVTERIHCVMIVDDDCDVRENLEEILVREGFRPQCCASAVEALAVLQGKHEPCVVLLDLVMPQMNGWDFLDELMQLPLVTSSHPVIIVSGASDAKAALKMPGVVAVLQKPFELEELIDTVREHAAPIGDSVRTA